MNKSYPILYSFRRCPYAMRARMAIFKAGIEVELREVVMRDRPQELYDIFKPGSVPVLHLPDGTVIGESLKVMLWALEQNDPDEWLKPKNEALSLIEMVSQPNGKFKYALDRYKYPDRYLSDDMPVFEDDMRKICLDILREWNVRIAENGYLIGDQISLADIAIFPFVRQYAHTDLDWFDKQDLKPLQNWLSAHKQSDLFTKTMRKYDQWHSGNAPLIWPDF